MVPANETLEQLLWRVRTSAHIDYSAIEPPRRKREKRSTAEKAVEQLSSSERAQLLEFLEGGFSISNSIVYKRDGDVWLVKSVGSQLGHAVSLDLASCTCEDFRYRKHVCKHITALKEALDGAK